MLACFIDDDTLMLLCCLWWVGEPHKVPSQCQKLPDEETLLVNIADPVHPHRMDSTTSSGYCKGTEASRASLTSSALSAMYCLKLNLSARECTSGRESTSAVAWTCITSMRKPGHIVYLVSCSHDERQVAHQILHACTKDSAAWSGCE